MKFVLISVAIFYCIHSAYATTNATVSQVSTKSSVALFDATPGFLNQYLDEDNDIKNLLETLNTLNAPVSGSNRFSTIVGQILSNIEKAKKPVQTLIGIYVLLINNVASYATAQPGIYNFPTSKVQSIIFNIQQIISILQDIDKGLLTLNNGGNSAGGISLGLGLGGGVSGTPTELTTQINLIGNAATQVQTFNTMLQGLPTSGTSTVINLDDLMTQSLILLSNLPNINDLLQTILKEILKKQANNALGSL